jgi:alpha-glucoside transport system substrate-binding protein
MARLLLEPGHLSGGQATAANLEFRAVPGPLVTDPPGCVLTPQGSDALSWMPFGVEPGTDVSVFPFPPVNPEQGRMVLGAGDYAVVFADRPEVREVVRALAGPEFGRLWVQSDPGFMSPRGDFPIDAYVTCRETCRPDPIRATLAPGLADAVRGDRFRFDGSDLLPHEMGLQPMWGAMVEFVGAGPDNLDRLLAELEATWVEREEAAAR